VIANGLPGAQQVDAPGSPATVEIVDRQGRVHAKATFQPPPAPKIGNAAPLMQSPVRVAAGAAYFADSTGAIRKLAPDGKVSPVATFPLTNSQQELTYAVSPDGAHVMAIVLSTPPLHSPPPQTLSDPLFVEGGHWTLAVETADAGGATTTTLRRDLGTTPAPTLIVGWDAGGPLATLNSGLGTQGVPLSAHFFGPDLGGAPLVHLAPDGTHLDRVGGSDCLAVDSVANGTVLCGSYSAPQFVVRSSSGTAMWQASLPSDAGSYAPWLSPDANAIAVQGQLITRAGVASAPGSGGSAQSQLIALGWLDSHTIVEATQSAQLSLYGAQGFTKVRDLGIVGIFEGVL
jgi:hypothetical protein